MHLTCRAASIAKKGVRIDSRTPFHCRDENKSQMPPHYTPRQDREAQNGTVGAHGTHSSMRVAVRRTSREVFCFEGARCRARSLTVAARKAYPEPGDLEAMHPSAWQAEYWSGFRIRFIEV